MTALQWAYHALDASGSLVSGEVAAESEPEAARQVRHLGLRPTRLVESPIPLFKRELELPSLDRTVKPGELASTVRQLATMLGSGVSMMRSLTVLTEQTEHPTLQTALESVRTDVGGGESLSVALGRHPRIFGTVFVALVRAGESAGALDVVLAQAADTLERQAELRHKIRSTLAYPLAVMSLVVIVVTAMSIFVVPVFRGVYTDLGHELPLLTTLVLAVTGFIGSNVLYLAAATLLSGMALRRWRRTDRGRRLTDRALLTVPILGGLIREAGLARTARSLSVLASAGVPLLEAVEITAATAGNEVLAEVIRDAGDGVRNGRQLSDPLAESTEIPALFAQVIAVGEESGDLAEMLGVVAEVYDDGVDAVAATFSAVVEPLMIAALGTVVGGLVLALYLPMFRLVDVVQ